MTNSNHPPKSEASRLNALHRYQIIGTPPEASFNRLATLAAQIFDLPMCTISFFGEDEVYFKASIGFGDPTLTSDKESLCNNLVVDDGVKVVNDVFSLPELANNIHKVGFYAGAPLFSDNGYRIGALCVMGYEARAFDETKQQILLGLADVVMDLVTLRLATDHLLKENENITADNAGLIDYQHQIAEANSNLEILQDNFEMLFEHAPMAIGIISGDDNIIIQANKKLLEILEKDADFIGEPFDAVVPELEEQDLLKLIAKLRETGMPQHGQEVKLLVWVEDHLKSLYINITLQFTKDLETGAKNIMFMLADTTEYVISKQLNQEANVVLMSAIEAGGMGYTVVEFATGKMISNDQFKQNYGYEVNEEFDYSDLFDAMLPKYRQMIKKSVQDAIENNGVYKAEYEVKWKDGSIHWISAFGKPRYDVHGRASHIIGLNKIIEKAS
ncbi:PAS domain-containing protein [Pedobacter sp. N23S346]|uniref:PAS domain-containing protein n=1 Tax=Pedobacter sp. N23S346 TaxID=3402750 RepID=UPI003AD24E3E